MSNKKQEILKVAHDIFYIKGFKDTNISEITSKAGIAVGSFYKYYSSKEEVFLDIYIEENKKIKSDIINKIDWSKKPIQVISEFIGQISQELSHNAILAEWYNKSISKLLHDYYASEEGREKYFFYQFSQGVLQNWMKDSKDSTKDIQTIMDIFNMVDYLDMHINEIGLTNCADSIKKMIEYLIKGMFPD